MKNLVVMIVLVLFGLECIAEGKPFTDYKEKGYTAKEAANIVSKDSVLANEYRLLFQQLAEKDGWVDSVGQVSFGNVVFLIERLKVVDTSWKSGEVVISSRDGKNGFKRFTRPSYSDRVKKTLGKEPVGLLDITSTTGWKNKNGNPFPVRMVMSMRCTNSIYDMRSQILPVSPLVKVASDDNRPDTVFLVTHDTIWLEAEDASRTVDYEPRYRDGYYYYEVPTFTYHYSYGSCYGCYSWCFPTYTFHGYHSCPSQVFNNYETNYYNSYTTHNYPRIEQGHGVDPPPTGGNGIDPPNERSFPPGGSGIDPRFTNVTSGITGRAVVSTAPQSTSRSSSTVRNTTTSSDRTTNNQRTLHNNTTRTADRYENKARYVDTPTRERDATRQGNSNRLTTTEHPSRRSNPNTLSITDHSKERVAPRSNTSPTTRQETRSDLTKRESPRRSGSNTLSVTDHSSARVAPRSNYTQPTIRQNPSGGVRRSSGGGLTTTTHQSGRR